MIARWWLSVFACCVLHSVAAVPLFNTISLQDFGAVSNSNTPVQPFSRFNPDQPLRTNDFQVLQQTAAMDREVVRINNFYVSQGPEGVGLTIPAFQTNTFESITTTIDEERLIFGAVESQELVRVTDLLSTQAITVSYSLPPSAAAQPAQPAEPAQPAQPAQPPSAPQPPQAPGGAQGAQAPQPAQPPQATLPIFPGQQIGTAPDEEAPSSAFFILYQCDAPVISAQNGATIAAILVNDEEAQLTTESDFRGELVPLVPPRFVLTNFTIVLSNGQTYFVNTVQAPNPLELVLSTDQTTLTAISPFTGFLRFSCTEPFFNEPTANLFSYNAQTPFLTTNNATIEQIFIDGALIDRAIFDPPEDELSMPLPPGRVFELILSTEEQWRFETDPLLPPVEFVLNRERTTFRSSIAYEGELNFGCSETGELLSADDLLNAEPTTIVFVPPFRTFEPRAVEQTFVDYNIIGNAFHDIEYNQLTPQISLGTLRIEQLFIDNILSPVGNPLPEGRKFKLEMVNERVRQTWLIYVEQSDEPITFEVDLVDDVQILRAVEPFTGILRIAVIQVTPIPDSDENFPPPARTLPPTSPTWSTVAVTQTFPPTPIASFILWPTEWVNRLNPEFIFNVSRSRFVPACGRIAALLPVLARTDFTNAFRYFQQIAATDYDLGNNQFITLFMFLLTNNLSTDIDLYQAFFRPQPVYGITPMAVATEDAYDAHRTTIPITADIKFQEDRYVWRYTTIDRAQNPLIFFPAYKTLDPFLHPTPVAGFGYLDPIKGDLLGVEAVDCTVAFIEGPVPLWYDMGFVPDFLSFSGRDLRQLQQFFAEQEDLDVTATDVVQAGLQIYEMALTVEYALFFYQQVPRIGRFVQSFTEPLINRIKDALQAWLIDRNIPNFFIGDTTTGGVCTISGMFFASPNVEQIDGGNAIYNSHHQQYGFWLGAAATVVAWDERFLPEEDHWIAQFVTMDTDPPLRRKDFVDMLWRDPRNVDKDDADVLPFNRHGNPWEGHSTQNGALYSPLATGRFQESFVQDFNSWVSTNQYAKRILADSALGAQEKAGFDLLAQFSEINLQLTATSGKLIYQDDTWLYGNPYAINLTVGQVFDTQTTAETTLELGEPPCELLTR